jgi:hypothetical protein
MLYLVLVKWVNGSAGLWDQREKGLVEWDWLVCWRAADAKLDRPLRPATTRKVVPEDPAPTKDVLRLHKGPHKAESALLVQAQTGRIGLARFLYNRRVPGIASAHRQCQEGEGNPRHIALFWGCEASRRHQLTDPAGRTQSYPQMIGSSKAVKGLVRWMLLSGRLNQFSLATSLLSLSE